MGRVGSVASNSTSLQRSFGSSKKKKGERINGSNGINLLPPFLNNPLISVAGKQSAMNR